MDSSRSARFILWNSKWLATGVIFLSLAILGGTILVGYQLLRRATRDPGQHANFLYALWLSQQYGDTSEAGLPAVTEDPADQLMSILVTTGLPQLEGLVATRLFDTNGEFVVGLPPFVSAAMLSKEDLEQLHLLKPLSRFHPQADLSTIAHPAFPTEPEETLDLLEMVIPLHAKDQKRLLGIAQFWVQGSEIAAEFAQLDRSLRRQSLLAFLVGGTILVAALGWSFRNLQRSNTLLEERTQSLLRANQELALAAKISAVGAVTAHLLHGLKNPLAGLQSFIANRESAPDSSNGDSDWEMAAATAKRMQNLINESVRVLREESSAIQYEIGLDELLEMIAAKTRPAADQAGLEFHTVLRAEGSVTNREANLIALVLHNLVQNALQATPRGKKVTLALETVGESIQCQVKDQGPGIPEETLARLFHPVRSTKESGTGIGLAISKQLAKALGAELELKSNSAEGCVFSLNLPLNLVRPAAPVAASSAGITISS